MLNDEEKNNIFEEKCLFRKKGQIVIITTNLYNEEIRTIILWKKQITKREKRIGTLNIE